MARTVETIKQEMRTAIMGNAELVASMELDVTQAFDEQFSKADPLRLITFIIAVAIWTLETLFDKHNAEVNNLIANLKPHSFLWYTNKAKAFLYGVPLVPESDLYNTENLNDEEIEAAKIVKYAAIEGYAGVLTLKVAGEQGEELRELDAGEKAAFTAYMGLVKDAGVNLNIVTQPADMLIIHATIYYDPLVLDGEGKRLDGGNDTVVEDAVKGYLRALPFNGQFITASLVDKLQATEGIAIPEVHSVQSKAEFAPEWLTVVAKHIAVAGYFGIQELNVSYEPNL